MFFQSQLFTDDRDMASIDDVKVAYTLREAKSNCPSLVQIVEECCQVTYYSIIHII